jgi:transcription elongation GreA/GreB family factor
MTEKREIHFALENFYTTRLHFSQMSIKVDDLKKKLAQYYPEQFKTAAHGDWRENSPKDTLDNEWSLDTTQLNKLNEQLARSVIIEDLEIETHEVVPGAKVILVNPQDKSEISLTMVSFTDLKEGYLSINSEAGKMLLGKMRADQVRLQKNGIGYFILDIRKPDPTSPVDKLESPEKEGSQQIPLVHTKTSVTVKVGNSDSKKTLSQQEVTQQEPIAQITQRPQEKTAAGSEIKKKKDTRPLIHRDDEKFNSVKARIVKMGGQITSETQSSKDLDRGKKETRSIFEFVVGGNRFKAELVVRPKIISTHYQHSKRQGTSADVIHTYGEEEIKTMYVYKLDGRNWVLVEFK